jgi:cation:H+ antiporter
MTGANRLLIGLGWAVVVLIACSRARTPVLALDPRQRLEMRLLLWATLYSFLIPLGGTISLLDAAVLLALFGIYVQRAMGGEHTEVELVGPAAMLDREFADTGRRLWALGMFVYAGYAIFVSAEPFADGLVHIGRNYRVDEFLLVQWVAPLASESPEFVIAILFAWKGRGALGIGALISSKVNQWTLLVGAIPVAYTISSGGLAGLPLDERQTEELLLTSAQSLLATVVICDLRFSRTEAIWLAILFLAQLAFPSTHVRYGFIVLYLLITLGLLLVRGGERRASMRALLAGGGGGHAPSTSSGS